MHRENGKVTTCLIGGSTLEEKQTVTKMDDNKHILEHSTKGNNEIKRLDIEKQCILAYMPNVVIIFHLLHMIYIYIYIHT